MGELLAELLKLSPEERMQLAEDLWDSVAADPQHLPGLTPEQSAEIERRLESHRSDPGSAITWDEVRSRLWSQLG